MMEGILKLQEVKVVTIALQTEKSSHSAMVDFYTGLFNAFVPEDSPETIAAVGYPPIIAFYQEQAQFHQCRVLWVEAKMIRYAGICDQNSAAL